MTFELGNQLAAGSSYNIEEQAKALDNWSKRDDATALCQFCVQQDIYAQRIYEWRDSSPLFAETLKKAKMRISQRLRKLLHDKKNPYNYGLFMSEIGFHDQFHHDFTESVKDLDYERKKALIAWEHKFKSEQGNQTPEEIKEQLNSLLALMSSAQSSRKIDSSKSNAETKS